MGMREKYQEKVDAQLREWQGWIDNYKIDPNGSNFDRPAEREQMMARLDDSQHNAQTCLEQLRSSQNEHWELSKQAVEREMIELKKLLDESGAAHVGRLLSLQTSRSHVYGVYSKRG